MPWERTETVANVTEWERADRMATVRIRERPDGRFVARVDRLEQAPEGPAYRRESVDDREAAETVATEMREAFDLAE